MLKIISGPANRRPEVGTYLVEATDPVTTRRITTTVEVLDTGLVVAEGVPLTSFELRELADFLEGK